MSLSRTSKWKVMTIQISRELPLFIFQHVDISWASDIHPSQKLWLFKFAASFRVQFQAPNILCAWIRHPSEKLWPFKFLESFRCSFWSMSIYQGPHTYTRVKSYGCLNLPRASVFNFERLNILCAWIGHPSEILWPFEFLKSFRGSFSSVSIYHGPHIYTRVKSYGCLNYPRASCWVSSVSIYYAPKSEIQVKYYDIWISWELLLFIFERLDILGASHTQTSQKLWLCEFVESIRVEFQASRYILCLNQRSEWNVMTIEFLESFRCSFASVLIYHGPHTYTRFKS